jgi:hypothetical protein
MFVKPPTGELTERNKILILNSVDENYNLYFFIALRNREFFG